MQLVSIIIPTFNRAHIIAETLKSVVVQTYTDWECIIVDDGSTDNTKVVLNEYLSNDLRFKFLSRPENRLKGPSACRNIGIENAKGEYIIFLDSDDLLERNCIHDRVLYLSDNKELDGAVFTTQMFDGNVSNLKNIFNTDLPQNSKEEYLSIFLKQQYPWTVMSGIWKKEILSQECFNEELILLEDVSFHIDLLFLPHLTFKRVKKVDNYYRMSTTNKFVDKERFSKIFKSFDYILTKHNNKIIVSEELKKNFSLFYKKMYLGMLHSNFNLRDKIKEILRMNHKEYITTNEKLLIYVLTFLHLTKLDTIKNIGVHTITSKLNKIIFKN